MSNEKPQERLKRKIGAGFKALADAPILNVVFQNGETGVMDKEAKLPPPSFNPDEEKLAEFRGTTDKIAIEYRYHNANIHHKSRPQSEQAGALFDALEEARVEAVGSQYLIGVKQNLTADLEKTYRRMGFDRLDENSEELQIESVKLYAREQFGKLPVPPTAQSLYAIKQPQIASKFQVLIEELSPYMNNQKLFAEKSQKLLQELLFNPTDMQDEFDNNDNDDDAEQQEPQETQDEQTLSDGSEDNSQKLSEQEQEKLDKEDENGEDEIDENQNLESLPSEPGDETREMDKRPRPEHDLSHIPKEPFYNVYTKEFDQEIPAEELIERDEEFDKYRKILDEQMGDLSSIIAKLANRLQRKLMAEQLRSWDFDAEDGMIDNARLSRIIIDPTQNLVYKIEREMKFKDTVVTLLIDNSGSMRGRPISIAAISTDILTRTLERCGLKVEILGFTTSRWKGGLSREKWLAHGKPNNPGRLNDLRHIIYKSAQTPYRKARRNISLMLRDGLLKENIDGEALLWAHRRLLKRSEERRILMVISDGAPVDDSTLSVNESNYLERHLRDAIDYVEKYRAVELCAIGIGHDVTRYYKKAVTINDVEQLASTMMTQLEELFQL